MSETQASRKALDALLDTVREIDRQHFAERGITEPGDVAEGERYLLHLLKAGLNMYFDDDAQRPHFEPIITPTQKLGGDGPDHFVYFAPLDGEREYRIRGRMTGEVYLSFTTHTTDGEGGWGTGVVSTLNDSEMQIADDGSYEILLSPERQPGNWLAVSKDTSTLITRHYFENPTPAMADPQVRVQMTIEPLAPTAPPLPYDDATTARKLEAVVRYMRGHTLERPAPSPETAPSWFSMVPNQLPVPEIWQNTDGGGFGAVDNAYAAAPFVLNDDQALVMEGRMPACRYANVCLWNRYMQTMDYRYRSVGLNRAQMTFEDDGSFRIVITRRDPGVPNWLDTEGRAMGIIYWRFLLPEGDLTQINCRVVPWSQLRDSAAG